MRRNNRTAVAAVAAVAGAAAAAALAGAGSSILHTRISLADLAAAPRLYQLFVGPPARTEPDRSAENAIAAGNR